MSVENAAGLSLQRTLRIMANHKGIVAGENNMLRLEKDLYILNATQVAAGTVAQLQDMLAVVCRLQELGKCQAWILILDESDSMHASLGSNRYKYEQVRMTSRGSIADPSTQASLQA